MASDDDEILISKDIKFWLERKPRNFVYTRTLHKALLAKILTDKSLTDEISHWHEVARELIQEVGLDAHVKKPYVEKLRRLLPFQDPKVVKAMAPEIFPLIEQSVLNELRNRQKDRTDNLSNQIEKLDFPSQINSLSKPQYHGLLQTIIMEKDLYEKIVRFDDAFWDGIILNSEKDTITEKIISLSGQEVSVENEDLRWKFVVGIIADISGLHQSLEPD